MEEKWVLDKDKAKAKWSKFSQDDLDRAAGSKLELVDFVRDRYGVSFEDASKQVEEFLVVPVFKSKGK